MANYYAPDAQPEFSMWFKTPAGEPLAVVSDFTTLYMSRVANNYGTMIADIEESLIAESYLQQSSLSEVHSKTPGLPSTLEMEAHWRLVKATKIYLRGKKHYRLYGYDQNHILYRTRIAYRSSSSETSKSGAVTTVARAIMLENLGSGASSSNRFANNAIASDRLEIEADKGTGPTVTADRLIAKRVLNTLRSIADQSNELGTPFFFDLSLVSDNKLRFETYLNQRGVDRGIDSDTPIVLSEKHGTLTNVQETEDWTRTYDRVFVGGAGQDSSRLIAVASNSIIDDSVYGVSEHWVDSRRVNDQTELNTLAVESLNKGGTRYIIQGDLVESALRYGRDYNFGDRVVVGVGDGIYEGRFDGIQTELRNGLVTRKAAFHIV